MFIRCEVIEQLEELSEKSRSKTKYFNHWSMAQVGSTEKKIMEVKNLAGEHSNTYLWDFDFIAMSAQLKKILKSKKVDHFSILENASKTNCQ